MNRGGRPL